MKNKCTILVVITFITLVVQALNGQPYLDIMANGVDSELRGITGPWYGLPRLEEKGNSILRHPDNRMLEQFFATHDKWRLSFEKGNFVATRRYLHSGSWRISPGGQGFVSHDLVNGKTRVRSLLMQIFLEGYPSAIKELLTTNGVVLTAKPVAESDNFVKSCATNDGGVVLYASEQSETDGGDVVTNAINYLSRTVNGAVSGGTSEGAKRNQGVPSDATTLVVTEGEMEGDYYARASVNVQTRSVFYLRIVNGQGLDVVGRNFMFEASNEVLDRPSDKANLSLYDCWFTVTTVQNGFKENQKYAVQLWCDDKKTGESTLVSSYPFKIKVFDP